MCHPIQDRALEHQLFELIINPASLQPIPEDRLETEDSRFRQAPAMVVALSLPLFTADFSKAPQILVSHMAFGLCVCLLPALCAYARWDGGLRAVFVESVVAFLLIVGAAGADLFDL